MLLLAAGLGAAGWWLRDLYQAPNRGDLSGYWQLVVAVPALVLSAVGLVVQLRARPEGAENRRTELDGSADLLAAAVQAQWTQVAGARRLLQPEPIPVRWALSARAVAAPAAVAAAATRFRPLPGFAATRAEQLAGGGLRDLHTVYAGLGSGRMIITGAPGAGKSAAAVLLLLAALRHRGRVAGPERAEVPVPVLFTPHGWDPSRQPLTDWLVAQLRQTYVGLFNGARGAARAAELIRSGRVAVIVDGLDEMVEHLRPVAFRALSEQADFRLVVLARAEEAVDAAATAVLDGAVAIELQDVEAATAADYLTGVQRHPLPHRWSELVETLRTAPESPIAQALSNPLALTLVRDTYRAGDDAGELLDLHTGAVTKLDVVDHLLERVLPNAYARRPGQAPPPYALAAAQRALSLIAARMSGDGTRDLAWWRIPAWASFPPRALLIGFLCAVLVWLGPTPIFTSGNRFITLSLELGSAAWIGGILGNWIASKKNHPLIGPTRWRLVLARKSTMFFLLFAYGYVSPIQLYFIGRATGLAASLGQAIGRLSFIAPTIVAIWLLLRLAAAAAGRGGRRPAVGRLRSAPAHPLALCVVAYSLGFMTWFFPTLLAWKYRGLSDMVFGSLYGGFGLAIVVLIGLTFLRLERARLGSAAALTAFRSWSRDRAVPLIIWIFLGIFVGGSLQMLATLALYVVAAGRTDDISGAPLQIVMTIVAAVSGVVLGRTYPETWSSSLAFVQLAIRWRTPIRLMRFLEDAHRRDVLRTVGPVYQFRHARLQDLLAESHSSRFRRAAPATSEPPRR